MQLRLVALIILGAFLSSCSTMLAYEQQRQARLAGKPAAAAEKPKAKPSAGTLLNPIKEKPKANDAEVNADASLAEAQAQLAKSDPTKTSGVAPGPTIAILKTTLSTERELESVARAYEAYAQAVSNVRVSLEAYGLKANLEGLRKVREASAYWALYLPRMRIRPAGPALSPQTVEKLYTVLSERGTALQADLAAINKYIDAQRTRVWTPVAAAAAGN